VFFDVCCWLHTDTVCSLKEKGDGNDLKFALSNKVSVEVKEIRTLTKWRHLSLDKKSALEITEVQQLEIVEYDGDDYSGSWSTFQGYLARPWSNKRCKENRDKGEYPLWYEAAVVLLELEELCGKNAPLRVGQKADWDAEDLRARGIFPSFYRPALQMVKQMDHVGRLDDNRLAGKYDNPRFRRGNDAPRSVPGLAAPRGGRRGPSRSNNSSGFL
jgi:hypothetical protein